jgi:hypothetical protein
MVSFATNREASLPNNERAAQFKGEESPYEDHETRGASSDHRDCPFYSYSEPILGRRRCCSLQSEMRSLPWGRWRRQVKAVVAYVRSLQK